MYFKLKNFEKAIGYYNQALVPRETAWGPRHPIVEENRRALQEAEQALAQNQSKDLLSSPYGYQLSSRKT